MLPVVQHKFTLTKKKEISFWLSYGAYKFVTAGLRVPGMVSLWFLSMCGRWPRKTVCTRPPSRPENQEGNRCTVIQSTRHLMNIPFLQEIWTAPYTYPTQFLLLLRTADTNINFQLEDYVKNIVYLHVGCLPFVRTGWQNQSSCKENSTNNQDNPARSVNS